MCTFLCPLQFVPIKHRLGYAWTTGGPLGGGLCCLWERLMSPDSDASASRNGIIFPQSIVSLLFPIKENACRSSGLKWPSVKGFWIVFKEGKYCFVLSSWDSLIMNWTSHKSKDKRFHEVQNSFLTFYYESFQKYTKENNVINPMCPSPWFNNYSLFAPFASSIPFYLFLFCKPIPVIRSLHLSIFPSVISTK